MTDCRYIHTYTCIWYKRKISIDITCVGFLVCPNYCRTPISYCETMFQLWDTPRDFRGSKGDGPPPKDASIISNTICKLNKFFSTLCSKCPYLFQFFVRQNLFIDSPQTLSDNELKQIVDIERSLCLLTNKPYHSVTAHGRLNMTCYFGPHVGYKLYITFVYKLLRWPGAYPGVGTCPYMTLYVSSWH